MVTILDQNFVGTQAAWCMALLLNHFAVLNAIPVNTTHRFLGRGSAQSFHPDEAAETSTTMVKSSMMAQTAFWSAQPPYRQIALTRQCVEIFTTLTWFLSH